MDGGREGWDGCIYFYDHCVLRRGLVRGGGKWRETQRGKSYAKRKRDNTLSVTGRQKAEPKQLTERNHNTYVVCIFCSPRATGNRQQAASSRLNFVSSSFFVIKWLLVIVVVVVSLCVCVCACVLYSSVPFLLPTPVSPLSISHQFCCFLLLLTPHSFSFLSSCSAQSSTLSTASFRMYTYTHQDTRPFSL